MSVRQYIGARYVPIFADPIEWNNTRTYEPLTMVTYYNNTYISKKTVPTGVAITNTEYWVIISNFNQQVSDLSTQVTALQDDMELIDINPFIPHLKNKKILICGASNEVNTAPSGREKTWARKLKELLDGIATVDIAAQGGAKLNDVITQVEDNVVGHDIIFICAPGNDPASDTELGTSPRNASSGTYGYEFERLKTVINSKYDKMFIIRGIAPMGFARSFRCKYPVEMYNNYCSVGSHYAGAIYIDGSTFFGSVNDVNMASLTVDGIHFKAPATDRAVYNALCAMCGFYNNNGVNYTAFVKDEYYDETSYPIMSSLITFESNYSTTNWRVNRIKYSRDEVIIEVRFSAAADASTGDTILTLDEGFCSMFNLANKLNYGILGVPAGTGAGTQIGCHLVSSNRTIVADGAVPSGILYINLKLDTGLMFDYPYDYHS